MASESTQGGDTQTRLAVVEAVQEEHRRRLDRLESKVDRILFAIFGATVVLLGAMTAGFWAVLAALAN